MKKIGKGKRLINKGFTLVEVLVVIAIIGVIVTLTGMNIKKTTLRRESEAAARKLKQIIEQTHDYAITGEVVDADLPAKFKFKLEDNTGKMQIIGVDKDGNDMNPLAYDENLFDPGENKIQIDPVTVEIVYTVPHGKLENPVGPIKVYAQDQTYSDNNDMTYEIQIDESNVDIVY